MALIIYGKTVCPICGNVIKEGQEVIAFSPFILNELDPLYFFNDAAFHTQCFYSHPAASKAQTVYAQVKENSEPQHRIDAVTGDSIRNPDDYLGLGYLTGDEANPLYPYNFLHFSLSNLAQWRDLPAFVRNLNELKSLGFWKGVGFENLLRMMEAALNRKFE